jgi:5-methylcytosine-specific restriction endonuclease McrA
MTKRNDVVRKRARKVIAASRAACHICGLPIDYTLKWPNKRCFVIDHVVPLDRGGADSLENLRAAHADCNSTKRARPYAPIVRRSGALD